MQLRISTYYIGKRQKDKNLFRQFALACAKKIPCKIMTHAYYDDLPKTISIELK